MYEVLKIFKRRTERTRVGYWNMKPVYCQALQYADDVVLITDSEEKLKGAVIEWTEILRGKGMAVNDMKSKVMRVCRIGDQVGNLHIMCNNIELEQTTNFEYLGTIIHQNGKTEEEALNRVRKTNNIYYQLNQTIFGKKEISTKTKLQVYRTVMELSLLYGSGCWLARGKEISRINAAEMKCFRRIAGKTRRDRIRNERIREDLG
jgi:hypothetical protein